MRKRIRSLGPDEPVPSSEPRRYPSGHGYVRLRWRLGPGEYVEAYEHRVVTGRPDHHVHHLDGDKTNNDPSNLRPMDSRDHARLHSSQFDVHEMAELYRQGLSTPQVARRLGCDAATVYRGLQRAGVTPRSLSESVTMWHAAGRPRGS